MNRRTSITRCYLQLKALFRAVWISNCDIQTSLWYEFVLKTEFELIEFNTSVNCFIGGVPRFVCGAARRP